MVYHNSSAYDRLSELIFGASGVDLHREMDHLDDDDDEIAEHHGGSIGSPSTPSAGRNESMAKVPRRTPLPMFYRFVPVCKVTVKSLHVMVGNMKLPYFLVASTASAQMLHSTGKGVSAHASYQTVTEVSNITRAAVYLQRNPSFISTDDLRALKRQLDSEDYFVIAMETMSKIFAEHIGGGPAHSERTGATRTRAQDAHWGDMDDFGMVPSSPPHLSSQTSQKRANRPHGDGPAVQMTEMRGGSATDNGVGLGFHLTDRDRGDRIATHDRDEVVIDVPNEPAASDSTGMRRRKEKDGMERSPAATATAAATPPEFEYSAPPTTVPASSSPLSSSPDRSYLLECALFHVEYSYDVGDALSQFDIDWFLSHLKAVPHHAAKQRLRVEFASPAHMSYGPWADHQRALMMSYFKPWDYRNQRVYTPKEGELWPYTSLVIEAVWLNDESHLTVPYRDLSRLMPELGLTSDAQLPDSANVPSAAQQWVELTFATDSWVSYELGWCVLQAEAGSTTHIKANFQHAVIWSPLPSSSTLRSTHTSSTSVFQPLIESELIEVSCDLNFPTLWNAHHEWHFRLNLHSSKIFYYSNHIDMMRELMLDWSKYIALSADVRKVGGQSLSYFVPSTMHYHLLFTEYEMYLNINENNVLQVHEYPPVATTIDPNATPSSVRHLSRRAAAYGPPPTSAAVAPPVGYGTVTDIGGSTYIILRGPDLLVHVVTDHTDFHARSSKVRYDVSVRNVRAHLSLPTHHPLSELIETKTSMQFLYVNNLTVSAAYQGHFKYNPEYRDSHTIAMTIEGAEGDCAGYVLRAIVNWKKNFIGDAMNWISLDEYRKYGCRNIIGWNKQIRYYNGVSLDTPHARPAETIGAQSGASQPSSFDPALGDGLPQGRSVMAEDRNASEMYFTLMAENLSLNLPLHLFTAASPSQQPKVRCYTVQVEVRSVLQYFDLALHLSPLTITVPIPVTAPIMSILRVAEDDQTSPHRSRAWNEKETYMHLVGLTFAMHQNKGDLPRLTVYRSSQKIGIDTVKVQLFPSQLVTLTACVQNLLMQYRDARDYSIPRRYQPRGTSIQLPSFVRSAVDATMRASPELIQIQSELTAFLTDEMLSTRLADLGVEINIGSVVIHLLHPPLAPTALTVITAHHAAQQYAARMRHQMPSAGATASRSRAPHLPTAHLSMTRFALPAGMQLYSSSLITPQSHSKLVFEVPSIDIAYLICTDVRPSSVVGGARRANSDGPDSAQSDTPSSSPPPPSIFERALSDRSLVFPPSPHVAADLSRWVSLCQIRLGATVTQADHRSDWLSIMRKQQDFVYSQMRQDGPMDDADAYSWHESNAAKVPYGIGDEAGGHATADATIMHAMHAMGHAQMTTRITVPGTTPFSLPVHHHHQPRYVRGIAPTAVVSTKTAPSPPPPAVATATSSSSSSSSSDPPRSSVTIEDDMDDPDLFPSRARHAASDPLNIVAEEERRSPHGDDRDHAEGEEPAPMRLPAAHTQHGRDSSAHYISHMRQRSLQISRSGSLHLKRVATTPHVAKHARSLSSAALPPLMPHTRHQTALGATLARDDRHALEAGSREGELAHAHPHPHPHASRIPQRPNRRRKLSRSASLSSALTSPSDAADGDVFESFRRISVSGQREFESFVSDADSQEDGSDSDDQDDAESRTDAFQDFPTQVEGEQQSGAMTPRSSRTPSQRDGADERRYEQAHSRSTSPASFAPAIEPQRNVGRSPRSHQRSQSHFVDGRYADALSVHSSLQPVAPFLPSLDTPSSRSDRDSPSPSLALPVFAEEDAYFPDFVPPLPTVDLQAYLEHVALDATSHAFVYSTSRERRAAAMHAHMNKPTVIDASLAGTSAGAFLAVPMVRFEALASDAEASLRFDTAAEEMRETDATIVIDESMPTYSHANTAPPVAYHVPAHTNAASATHYFAASTAGSTVTSRRGSFVDATEGGLPASNPPMGPRAATASKERAAGPHGKSDVSYVPTPLGVGTTAAPIQPHHLVLNSSKLVVEFTSDVTVMLCPSFLANVDQYLPFMQTTFTTVEDTLDELHRQFTSVCHAAADDADNAARTPEENNTTVALQAEYETWHTMSVQRSVLVPRLYVELLQSSASAACDAASPTSIAGLHPSPSLPEPKSVIYATTISMDGLTANVAQTFPLPTVYTNLATGIAITEHAPLPTAQGQISMNRLHAYSCILNPPRHCAVTAHSSSSSHVHTAACWGPNSIAIPHSELDTLLPPAILDTSAVFVSIELNHAVMSLQHHTHTEANPMYVRPAVAQLMRDEEEEAAHGESARVHHDHGSLSPAAVLSSARPHSSRPTNGRQDTVLWNEASFHTPQPSLTVWPIATPHTPGTVSPVMSARAPRAAKSASAMTSITPALSLPTARLEAAPPATVIQSGVALEPDGLHRSFSFEDAHAAGDTADDFTPVRHLAYFLHPSMPVPQPSPPTLNALTHSHSSVGRIHLANVSVLSGWDAPSRVVSVTRDWITALNQLEFVGVAQEWFGESGVRGEENEAPQAKSSHGRPLLTDPLTRNSVGDPALALFATLPGGPATALRRLRWQTLVSFALQHIVHSRALDEDRGGAKAFGELDQLRLLQWMYHRVRANTDEPVMDEVGAMLAAYQFPHPAHVLHDIDPASSSSPLLLPPSEVNFVSSPAAPLTLALRKLVKLPPNLMRRLNFKLQRPDELGLAGGVGVAPSGTGWSDGVHTGDVDFTTLYDSDKLDASELARLSLRVFSLVAPQAAKIRTLARPTDLSPALWQSRHHEELHLDDLDQRDTMIEWEMVRVRTRVTHAPAEEFDADVEPSAQPRVPLAAPRDHAISINRMHGLASFNRLNSFVRLALPISFSTRGAMPANMRMPRDFPLNLRPPTLVRTTATRTLHRDAPIDSPTSGEKLSVTLSPPTPVSATAINNRPQLLFSSPGAATRTDVTATTATKVTSGWPQTQEREYAPAPRTDTIHEGSEEFSSSPIGLSPPPRSPVTFHRRLDVASPSPSAPSSPSPSGLAPLSHPLVTDTGVTPRSYHWSQVLDLTCTSHASDVLVDVGPDIHRFLASLTAATFEFAEIHQKNVESTRNAARRMKNRDAHHRRVRVEDGAHHLHSSPMAPTTAAAASSLPSIAANRMHTVGSEADDSFPSIHTPLVTSNYFLLASVDSVGIRARVPGTAALHLVSHGSSANFSSWRPLSDAERESKQRAAASAGAAAATGKKPRKEKKMSSMSHAAMKIVPTLATVGRQFGVGGTRLALTGGAITPGPAPTPAAGVGVTSSLDSSGPSRPDDDGRMSPAPVDAAAVASRAHRMLSATMKMQTIDIRLVDQDIDIGGLDDLSSTFHLASMMGVHTGGGGTGGGGGSSGARIAAKKKGTVLLSLFMRQVAFQADQALLHHAYEMSRDHASQNPRSPEAVPSASRHWTAADRVEAGAGVGAVSHHRLHSPSPPSARSPIGLSSAAAAAATASTLTSVRTRVRGSQVDRLTLVLHSDQSVLTLPFHQLEQMRLHEYVGPWMPVLDVFRVSSALDDAKAAQEAEAAAERAAADATMAEGYTAAAFAWMRGETKVRPAPVSLLSPTSLSLSTMSGYLSRSNSPTHYTYWSILGQLRNVSVVMLPLASVMFTYHLDRIYVKLTCPKPQELHLMLSIGMSGDDDEQRTRTEYDASHESSRTAAATASTHKITLHSSVKKKSKPPMSHSGDPEDTEDAKLTSANAPPCRHPLERPLDGSTATRVKGTKYLSAATAGTAHRDDRHPPSSLPPAGVAAASASFPSSHAHAAAMSKMQFVLEFKLPTVRASLRIREHDLRTTDSAHVGPVQPVVGGQPHTHAYSQMHPTVTMDESDDSSGEFESQTSSSDSSPSDLTSSSEEEDESEASHHTPATHSRRPSFFGRGGSTGAAAATTTKSSRAPTLLHEIDGLIAVGSMSNHLDENVLSRLLHLQSTLNAEVNQLLDKIARYSKEAGLDGAVGSAAATAAVSGAAASTRRPSVPARHGAASPDLRPTQRSAASPQMQPRPTVSKRLSTLHDIQLGSHAHSTSQLPMSPLSQPVRARAVSASNRPLLRPNNTPTPNASSQSHARALFTSSSRPPSSSSSVPVVSRKLPPSLAAGRSDDSTGGGAVNVWDRFAFNVNFSFANIHITAGLSPKKTTVPTNHAIDVGPYGVTSPATIALALALAASKSTTPHERAAHFQPILHVTTGTFSLSMRYRPKVAFKLLNRLDAIEREEAEQRAAAAAAAIAAATSGGNSPSDRHHLRIHVDKLQRNTPPPSGSTQTASPIVDRAAASSNATSVAREPTSTRSFRAEDGSNVMVEFAFQGVGLKLSTLTCLPTQPSLFAGLMMPQPTPAATAPTRRTLIECRADLRLRVGFKVNATYTHADCRLDQTLMKVTAIPITTTSAYVLATEYMRAYAEYQVEKTRLVQEKQIRDPLIGLRALKADRVWSHLQSEFPVIKSTLSDATHTEATAAATATTAATTNTSAPELIGEVESRAGDYHHRRPTGLDIGAIDGDISHASDLLSPTSAAAAVAVASGHDAAVPVGTGSMIGLPAAAPPSTKYELHFSMKATELVMLFEKDVASNARSREETAAGRFEDDRIDPLGLFAAGMAEANVDGTGLPTITCTPTPLSALVVFLDDLNLQLEFVPPTTLSPFARLGVAGLQLPFAPTATSLAYALHSRPPVNSLTSSVRLTGLELGCLAEDVADTNVLDELAQTLRKYRSPHLLHTPSTAGDSATARRAADSETRSASPNEESSECAHPFRSFSLHTPVGSGESDSQRDRARVRHVYNRIVVRSTEFSIRGALPVAAPPAVDEPPTMRSAGGPPSGTHSRHRSHVWPQTPMQTSGVSAPAHPSLPEWTLVIDTHSTGAELDIDASLVRHLSNLTSLVDLLADFTPSEASNSRAASPRGSVIDPDGAPYVTRMRERQAPMPVFAGVTSPSADESLARPASRGGGLRATSLGSSSGESINRSLSRPAMMRRRSIPDLRTSDEDSDSTSADEDEEQSSNDSTAANEAAEGEDEVGLDRMHSLSRDPSLSAHGGPISPPMGGGGGGGGSADGTTTSTSKFDLNVEFRLQVAHGRCCLHALPKSSQDGLPLSPPSPSGSSADPNEDVYADFVLPSIVSTLILQTSPKEDLLLMVELSMPPLTINPTMMHFLEEVRAQMDSVERARANASKGDDDTEHTTSTNGANSTPSPMPRTTSFSSPIKPSLPDFDGGVGAGASIPPIPVDAPTSLLTSFLHSCGAASRSITVNLRLKHTYVRFNCLPMNDHVYLQFGTKRNVDLCFTVTTLDQVKFGLPVSIPYLSCTLNVPLVFVQLGLLHSSAASRSTSAALVTGPTFLDLRCRHLQAQVIEAVNIRSDAAPIRTVFIRAESISPAVVTMNVVSALVVFSKVWIIHSAAQSTGGSHGDDEDTPSSPSPPTTSTAMVPSSNRAAYYYVSLGKFDAEVNMLDVSRVQNKSTLTVSRLCGRLLDIGGAFPHGCHPIMATIDTDEITLAVEADADGIDGTLQCAQGVQWRFCRLPLDAVHQTSFDFFHPPADVDAEYSGIDTDTDRDEFLARGATSDLSGSSRHTTDEDGWSDAASVAETVDAFLADERRTPSPTKRARRAMRSGVGTGMTSRQGKRMVNMMEFHLRDLTAQFHLNHGLTPLLLVHSALTQVSLLDQWNDRVDGVGYVIDDGDWCVKLYVDIGDRLSVESSSRAIPHFLEIVTQLIAFTQTEFKRIELPKEDNTRTPFGRLRRLRVARERVDHVHAADELRDEIRATHTRKRTSDERPAASSSASTLLSPTSLRAGLLSLRGTFVELKLGSDVIAREFVCIEVHDFSVSLQRSLFYSASQLKEQSQLLQLRRKRQSLSALAHRDSVLFGSPGGLPPTIAVADPETITTEEDLATAMAALDDETDPLKRLKKRSSESYRGGLLRPLTPIDVYRTLLIDIGQHRKIPNESGDSTKAGYLWVPEPHFAPSHSYVSQLGAIGPGIYVSRLSQSRDRTSDDMDHIFRIPGFVLEMETLDPLEQSSLRSRFLTFWDKTITVAIDVRVYKLLYSMGTAFANHLNRALVQVERQAAEAQADATKAIKAAAMAAEADSDSNTDRDESDARVRSSSRQRSTAATSSLAVPTTKRSVRFNLVDSASPRSDRSAVPAEKGAKSSSLMPPPHTSPRVHQRSPSVRVNQTADPAASSQLYTSDASPSSSPSLSPVPVAPKLHKPFAPDSHYDLNNPSIHVLDHAGTAGISVRRIIDIMQSVNANLKSKEEQQFIPGATHELTEALDRLLDSCVQVSRAIDRSLER